MTPRHPPRALTGLTTPIGPPLSREGGRDRFRRAAFGPGPSVPASRDAATGPEARFGSSLDLEGFLLLLFLRPERSEDRPGRETVVWSMPLTRHPFRRAPRGENSRADVRGWAFPRERPCILVPTSELPKSADLPAGGRRRPQRRRRPPPGEGGGVDRNRGTTAKTGKKGPRRGTARPPRLGGRRPTWRGSLEDALAASLRGSIREPIQWLSRSP